MQEVVAYVSSPAGYHLCLAPEAQRPAVNHRNHREVGFCGASTHIDHHDISVTGRGVVGALPYPQKPLGVLRQETRHPVIALHDVSHIVWVTCGLLPVAVNEVLVEDGVARVLEAFHVIGGSL